VPAWARLVPTLLLTLTAVACRQAGGDPPVAAPTTASSPSATSSSTPSPSPSGAETAPAETAPPSPSTRLRLRLDEVLTGDITPKSIVASQTGLFFAQNMMYRHTITVYDRRFRLVETIPDAVRLSRLGYPAYPGVQRGAPVEAAFTPDGRFAYVSNYSMYGPGFSRPGHDVCSPSGGYDRSFVYRVDVQTLDVDQAIRVGSVPKFVAVTPDARWLLVSNWCTYDLSVVSVRKGKEVRRIPLGPYPRGIAVDPASRFAYVAVMGTRDVARVSLRSGHVGWIRDVGGGPRHLAIDPEGRFLYVTLNAEGMVATVDLERHRVVARVRTGVAPRSMTIAPDGRSLYVVNYGSGTMTKLRARDLHVLQTVRTDPRPIGIAYDAATRQIWVACYGGSLMVFRDA
jgi:DNA-binding beta-propeller fold protein YncE